MGPSLYSILWLVSKLMLGLVDGCSVGTGNFVNLSTNVMYVSMSWRYLIWLQPVCLVMPTKHSTTACMQVSAAMTYFHVFGMSAVMPSRRLANS